MLINSVPEQPTHLHWLDAGRAFASLAVVLHHVGAIAMQQHGVEFAGGMFSLGHLRPDFFFVLSGFIITWVHGPSLGKSQDGPAFLKNRFRRLYPLLFLLTTVKVAIILLLGGWRWNEQALDSSTLITSYLLVPTGQYPVLLAAWTMPYEAFFYVIFTLAGMMGSRTALLWTILPWSFLILALNAFMPALSATLPWRFIFNPYLLQMFAGVLTCLLLRSQKIRGSRVLLLISACMLLAGMWEHDWLAAQPRLVTRCWWAFTFCALISGAALEEGRCRPPQKRLPEWLSLLARSSYSTYLVHGPALVVLLALGTRWHLLDSQVKNLTLATCAALAVMAGILCHFWIEKPLQKLLPPRPRSRAGHP